MSSSKTCIRKHSAGGVCGVIRKTAWRSGARGAETAWGCGSAGRLTLLRWRFGLVALRIAAFVWAILGIMQKFSLSALRVVLSTLTLVLIVKVALGVLLEYGNYFPPNFRSDFLRGRGSYFWGGYHWAFYAHLISGPASLLLGTILVSDWFRSRAPSWHRRLGRIQVANVLLMVAPSGLYMSWYAETGAIAGAGLGSLAIATAACAGAGWRAAVTRRFAIHRRWMLRAFLLLCSAVVIRMIGGLASVLEFDAPWLYPASCWLSWLLPLLVFECWHVVGQRPFSSPHLSH
jgi:hypothetical protein